VTGSIRPALDPSAWRLVLERRVCSGSRCRWTGRRELVAQRRVRAGAVSLAVTLRPGRYRVRALLRDAAFARAQSPARLVAVR
jgi:hypothetical protein